MGHKGKGVLMKYPSKIGISILAITYLLGVLLLAVLSFIILPPISNVLKNLFLVLIIFDVCLGCIVCFLIADYNDKNT